GVARHIGQRLVAAHALGALADDQRELALVINARANRWDLGGVARTDDRGYRLGEDPRCLGSLIAGLGGVRTIGGATAGDLSRPLQRCEQLHCLAAAEADAIIEGARDDGARGGERRRPGRQQLEHRLRQGRRRLRKVDYAAYGQRADVYLGLAAEGYQTHRGPRSPVSVDSWNNWRIESIDLLSGANDTFFYNASTISLRGV